MVQMTICFSFSGLAGGVDDERDHQQNRTDQQSQQRPVGLPARCCPSGTAAEQNKARDDQAYRRFMHCFSFPAYAGVRDPLRYRPHDQITRPSTSGPKTGMMYQGFWLLPAAMTVTIIDTTPRATMPMPIWLTTV
jgi:hypothetical protein